MKKSKRKQHHALRITGRIKSIPPSPGKSGSCRSCGKTNVDLHKVTDIYICGPCIEEVHSQDQCTRCKGDFKREHFILAICNPCIEKDPKLTTKEKNSMNLWDHIDDVIKVIDLVKQDKWCWSQNMSCKYLDVRIDMRDGVCLINDKEGRIGPDALAWQYEGEEGNERPDT